jgi:HlyD family secretion protein
MHITRFIPPFFRTKLGIAILFAVVAVGGFVVFSGQGSKGMETFTVSRGDFVQQVSISGKVIPAEDVDLGFTYSGRIARVYVKVGQQVPAGATLAEIDGADARATLLQKEAALDVQKAKLASLQQGTRPEEIAVAEAAVAKDEAALAQAYNALADAIQSAYIQADDAVRNKVYTFVSNPRTNPQITVISSDTQAVIDATANIVQAEAVLVAWAADIRTMPAATDLSAHVARAQQNLALVTALLNSVSKVLNSATLTNLSQTVLDGYISSVATGRVNVSGSTSALTSAVTAQKAAATALVSSKKTLALKKAGTVQADIDAQAAQVKAAEADVANARAALAKIYIMAPFAGVITKVDAKAGKIVSPNTPEISMDSASAFQIESYVPEVNIASIKVRDTAIVTLDAYGAEVPFAVQVVSIDPADTVKDGVPTYRALLQFDATDPRILSGMTANIVVTTAQKSDVISIPQGLVIERNGGKYVKVVQGENISEREVSTGLVSSAGTIEILSGLLEGDILFVKNVE